MSHPYRSAGRDGAKLKFSKMLGTTTGAKHLNDDSVVSPNAKVSSGVENVKIMAKTPPARLDRARGGKVARKGNTTVNVIIPPSDSKPPMPMPLPPAPPPGPMAGGPPPGPGAMPPRPPMGPTPGAGLPLPKARGGYISGEAKTNQLKQWAKYSRKNSYHRKDGGSIGGKYGLKAGQDSGVGRLELTNLARGKVKKSPDKL